MIIFSYFIGKKKVQQIRCYNNCRYKAKMIFGVCLNTKGRYVELQNYGRCKKFLRILLLTPDGLPDTSWAWPLQPSYKQANMRWSFLSHLQAFFFFCLIDPIKPLMSFWKSIFFMSAVSKSPSLINNHAMADQDSDNFTQLFIYLLILCIDV